MERGTWEQLRWLLLTYGEESAADWVRRHGLRLLSSRSFALWRLVFGIRGREAPGWAAEARGMETW